MYFLCSLIGQFILNNVLSTGFDWKQERQSDCVHLLSNNLSTPKLLRRIPCGMFCR